MEKVGTTNIFERPVQKHGLYYTSFYGDGDSKSFSAVEKVYGPAKPVTKYECIGHYQKRVGNRLRKLRTTTSSKIDILQYYFGIALRQNVGNLENMTNAIHASLYHVSGYHDSCPKTNDGWCQYKNDKVGGTNLFIKKRWFAC